MEISIADARAPWVEFKLVSEEDREATEASGMYRAKDIEYVVVTPAGSKDEFESPVAEWFKRKETDVKDGRLDPAWLRAWKEKYQAWKEGRQLPPNGTPILSWPPISPAQRQTLIHWKVMTVEALAEANEEVIMRLGMGGRALKQLAIDYLKSANDVSRVALELNSMRVKLDTLQARNERLEAENKQLRMVAGVGSAAAQTEPARMEVAGGLLDEDDSDAASFEADPKPFTRL